jgi:hypothetical protein
MNSCEGYRCANGIVIDKANNKPLDSVLCTVTSGTESIYTDSTGSFDVCNRLGGCSFGCKSITVEFSKPGYKVYKIADPEANTTVYMER